MPHASSGGRYLQRLLRRGQGRPPRPAMAGSLILLAALGWRFLRTGGPEMLRMMESPHDHQMHHGPSHDHHTHHEAPHDHHMHHD